MVSLVTFALALVLAYHVGAYRAREREKARLAAGRIERFEAELIRMRGRRPHPNPEAAPVVTRIRYLRR